MEEFSKDAPKTCAAPHGFLQPPFQLRPGGQGGVRCRTHPSSTAHPPRTPWLIAAKEPSKTRAVPRGFLKVPLQLSTSAAMKEERQGEKKNPKLIDSSKL